MVERGCQGGQEVDGLADVAVDGGYDTEGGGELGGGAAAAQDVRTVPAPVFRA
jgi:hypothetical protein